MIPKAIFDNTVFNFFVRFSCADLSNIVRTIISNGVFIPLEILNEMEKIAIDYPEYQSKIFYWSDQIRRNRYYKLCTTYDAIVYDFVKSRIDKGEAEAVAQSQKTGIRFFITDDLKCQPFIQEHYPSIKTYSTFFLLSIAEINGLLPDYKKVFKEYHQILNYQKFGISKKKKHKAKLRFEYTEAVKNFGFPYNKKEISEKTSVDKILKN
ncbi:MAG: hypothetical protein HY738_21490 [Bacteroidia bacterium]|nr:hypothetical protein [Bacteroidia bacterium]